MTMLDGIALDPLRMVGQPIIFFDAYANTTKVISRDIPRRAAHLIVEAFPTSPGVATVQVVDANGQAGQLTAVTDSNGVRNSISAYTKFLAKGVMERVAIQLSVQSGAWSVWGTFTEQASDRANYYDRNPLQKSFYGNQNAVAPHGQSAARWSYTVPTGKKAFIESLMNLLYRNTAAGSPGLANITVQYTPSGGVTAALDVVILGTNGVADQSSHVLPTLGLMQAGDTIVSTDADLSTGGTCTFVSSLKGVEFDA